MSSRGIFEAYSTIIIATDYADASALLMGYAPSKGQLADKFTVSRRGPRYTEDPFVLAAWRSRRYSYMELQVG